MRVGRRLLEYGVAILASGVMPGLAGAAPSQAPSLIGVRAVSDLQAIRRADLARNRRSASLQIESEPQRDPIE